MNMESVAVMKNWIVFVALLSLAEAGCPSTCTCTVNSVYCIGKKLECVPNFDSLTNYPLIIDISGNKINYINPMDFSFDKAKDVKEIYLNNSEVVEIEASAFDEVVNVQELYLGQNLLNNISENLIEKQDNIILLDISNNYFSRDLPTLRSKSLEVLAVANSKVSNVPENSLKHLPNLKMLLLQQNNIKYISPVVFQKMNSLFFVRLAFNKWNCNCDSAKLFEYLSANRYIDPAESIQCFSDDNRFTKFYENGVVTNDIKQKCRNRSNVDEDIYNYKQAKTNEAMDRMNMENEIIDKDSAKPYSLVKLNNTTADKNVQVIPPKCDDNTNSSPPFQFNFCMFLLLMASFCAGILIGSTLIYAKMRVNKLDMSDSTAKLIVT